MAHPETVGTLIPVASGPLLQAGDLDGASEIDLEVCLAGPQRRVDAVPAELRDRVFRIARLAYARQAERGRAAQADPPASGRVERSTAPTLVIVGDCDVPIVLDFAEVLSARIPGAVNRVCADSAHMVDMEHPRSSVRSSSRS